jgi:hypothetical protein
MMSKQAKTRPAVNRSLDELRDIRVVVPPALANRLRRYRRHVGIEDARNYIRYCVMITTQLLQLVREGNHIFIVGNDGQICYELSFDSVDLGFDVARIKERLDSFEF